MFVFRCKWLNKTDFLPAAYREVVDIERLCGVQDLALQEEVHMVACETQHVCFVMEVFCVCGGRGSLSCLNLSWQTIVVSSFIETDMCE
jgi:hypothetical protein|eukprot:COSAG06_NODE_1003_length_11130_cov_5.230804_13_plen_89_part_00